METRKQNENTTDKTCMNSGTVLQGFFNMKSTNLQLLFIMRTKLSQCGMLYCLIQCILLPELLFGQTNNETVPIGTWMRQNVYSPSAQAWDFVRYGNTPVNLYTGTARVEIPVYTYNDADFTIPISLGYAYGGFMPAQQTGIVGLGWFLNAGGMISREIRGLDDFYGEGSQGTKGFLLNSLPYSDSLLLTKSTDSDNDMPHCNKRETLSDIYHFNFPGHSGTFHFDGEGNCCVYNTNGEHGCYKVEYTRANNLSQFTIQTADGFKYVFGGIDKVDGEVFNERVLNGGFRNSDCYFYYNRSNDGYGPIVSWMLREIIAPNGRSVKFCYENGAIQGDMNGIDAGRYSNYITTYSQDVYMVQEAWSQVYMYKRPNILKTTYLSRIEIGNNITVDFKYSPKDDIEVTNVDKTPSYHKIISALQKLNTISITNNQSQKQIISCSLSYENRSNRTLLNRVSISNIGDYEMEYQNTDNMPDLLSNGIDFWGYANGKEVGDDAYLSGIVYDSNGDEHAAGNSSMLPDYRYGSCGALKKIIYPTGGWTEFEYEGHTAKYAVLKRKERGNILEFNQASEIVSPYMESLHEYNVLNIPDGQVGGIRIRRITDNDGEGNQTSRTFDYTDENGESTGILLRFPKYNVYWSAVVSDKGFDQTYSVNLVPFRNTFDKSAIEYTQVTEIRDDNAKIVYRYSNYMTHPDDYSGQTYLINRYGHNNSFRSIVTDSIYRNNILREPNSRHNQRGKLLSQDYYNTSGELIQSNSFEYENHNKNSSVDYSAYVVMSCMRNWSAKLYTGDFRLIRRKTTDYLPTGTHTTITEYGYTTRGQIQTQRTVDGIDTLISRTVYIPDIPSSKRSSAEQAMYQAHRYAPVEVQSCRQIDGMDRVVAVSRCQYQLFNNVPYPGRIQKSPIASACLPENIPAFQDELICEAYDSYGNIMQTTDKSGLTTCYLWSGDGLYLLAKIENFTCEEIRQLISQIFYDIASLDKAVPIHYYIIKPDKSALNPIFESHLRAIAKIQATTYEYNPGYGVSKITDSAGRSTSYEYYHTGHLAYIKNQDGDVIKRFRHQTKNGLISTIL